MSEKLPHDFPSLSPPLLKKKTKTKATGGNGYGLIVTFLAKNIVE